MAGEAHPHLRIEREQPINEKRSKGGFFSKPPSDIPAHANGLRASLQRARAVAQVEIPGFDARPLFKLQVGALDPEQIEKGFPGVEVVSQEEGGFALVFANDEALAEFEARLTSLAAGGQVKYQQIIYALQAFDRWSTEDRKGWALKRDGFPEAESFVIDVELWPLGRGDERAAMIEKFDRWLADKNLEILDRIATEALIARRIRTGRAAAEELLGYRDVRMVDLPPRFGIDLKVLQLDIQDLPAIPRPAEDAPAIGVLDSGVAGGHPLIGPALGDAQGFLLPDRKHEDESGHGTHVAGIALYGDVEECAAARSFVPQLRLFSGRVLDSQAHADWRFIENIIDEAVRYFHRNYGCRVFNLSYGDLNRPYVGTRVRSVAQTLDRLARELDILFVVPTGNILGCPEDWLRHEYPDYLFKEDARLVDPAPALNVLTVGSLARWDRTHNSWRWPNDVADRPIAERDQPSPFSRCGASVKGAVKPELVAYGGNQAVDPRDQSIKHRWLGELSTNKDFAQGALVAEKIGTSFASPHVAHLAARALGELPGASANLLRAILVANARVPSASANLFGEDEEKLAQTIGYGMVDPFGLYRSTEEHVLLIAEAKIKNKTNHFYEIPIPESFYGGEKRGRRREISVALAYCPPVRTTRLDYKASRIEFRLAEAESLDEVTKAFDNAMKKQADSIKELGGDKFCYGTTKRSYGTVQGSTWAIKRAREGRLFAVVSRNDCAWGESYCKAEEDYALVIKLTDRENQNARLYTEIRVQLQARERLRARARG